MRDIAIIGGGVSGCYCAYRLSTHQVLSGDVALFEGGGRIGGRLWSTPIAGSDLPAEIGGMFFRAHQKNVRALIEHLGLATDAVDFRRAGQFVRGRWASDADFAAPNSPFNLDSETPAGGPTALLLFALEQIAPGSTDLWPINRTAPRSAQLTFDWLRQQRHNGRPLENYSLWNVCADVVSNEAYALLISTLGTTSLLRNVNAFDGVWSLLHEIGDGPGFRLRDGYQALPLELVSRAEAAGVAVRMGHRLQSVVRTGEHIELSFMTQDGERAVERARRVIFALPQRALQLIAFDGNLFEDSAAFARIRDGSVAPMRSCKIFLSYEQAWWADTPNAAQIAARYTDLPIQQCYHFGNARADAPALAMAAYADDVSAQFWKPLAESGETFPSAAQDDADARALMASPALVQSARRQLAKVHGRANTPEPSGALYFDWGSDPYGGAWHAWAPHVKSWEIRPWMRQPNPNLDLYICGEAYAQRNGWVEGAINSAERTLERLGLSRPVWIDDPDFQFEIDDGGVEDDDSNHADVQRDVSRHVAAA